MIASTPGNAILGACRPGRAQRASGAAEIPELGTGRICVNHRDAGGAGYQRRINAVLRSYVEAARRGKRG